MDPNLPKKEERSRTLEDKLVKFLNQNYKQNFNDIEIKVGNDKENDIIKFSDVNKEYLCMQRIAIHFISSYIAKKFDENFFIDLITNFNDGFQHLEYNEGDKES